MCIYKRGDYCKHPYESRKSPCVVVDGISERKCAAYIESNYDYIRSLSVDEMAAWFLNRAEKILSDPEWCESNCDEENGCPHESDCVIAWLNSPAED